MKKLKKEKLKLLIIIGSAVVLGIISGSLWFSKWLKIYGMAIIYPAIVPFIISIAIFLFDILSKSKKKYHGIIFFVVYYCYHWITLITILFYFIFVSVVIMGNPIN